MRVLKGHGTENDFVLVPDLDGVLDLGPGLVQALCDRRAGIGADGVLRVVRSERHLDAADLAGEAPYFMDYRNADGSLAEMCGNGIRVVMRYLLVAGLVDHSAAVATRGGVKCVWVGGDGNVSVEMGPPRIPADRPVVTAAFSSPRPGRCVEMPNPHVVVELDGLDDLAALELSRPPAVENSPFTDQNVEFVVRVGPRHSRHLGMRVHERGVGETRSCGTGVCAVVAALATADGTSADDAAWRVDVPGGTCQVTWRPDGQIVLTGPAVLVGEIDLDDGWLAAASAVRA
jgi:diaminopimelate epimerase